jgi:hypothetical protein
LAFIGHLCEIISLMCSALCSISNGYCWLYLVLCFWWKLLRICLVFSLWWKQKGDVHYRGASHIWTKSEMHIIGDAPPFSSRIEFIFSPTSPPKLRVDQLINRWRTIHSKISNSLQLQRGPWKEVASVKNMFLVFFVQGSKREMHLYITRLGFKPNWRRTPIMLISHLNQKGNMWYRGTSCLPSIKSKTCITGGISDLVSVP